MISFKKYMMLGMMFGSVVSVVARPAEHTKIAWVVPQEIMGDKGAKAWLESIERLQADLKVKFEAAQALEKKFGEASEKYKKTEQSKGKWSSDSAKEKAEKELQELYMQVAQAKQEFEDYQMKTAQAMQMDFIQKIEEVMEEFAHEHKWDSIQFFTGGYLSPKFNVTKEIVAMLDAKHENAKKAAAKVKNEVAKKAA